MKQLVAISAFALVLTSTVFGQQPAAQEGRGGGRGAGARVTRPPLFFKEEWKQTAQGGEHPIVFDSTLSNPNLELKVYGPSSKELLLTGAVTDENNPIHIWTGMCTTPCAVALRHKTHTADLSGLARLRWNTKVSGFHQIRPIVKLADGTWLVGDRTDGTVRDWLFTEFSFGDVRWLRLDIARAVTTGTVLDKVDLSKVDEIGFVDLMPGSGHGQGGWVDVAQIEVYANSAPRTDSATSK
ncbi:MAG TPA: hypothetical protein VFB92_20610 [Vicinamibacterales bacterium]|jgi:hypothetical protein|nr:hypothetical protein [Vicinamibacterales bacterium]